MKRLLGMLAAVAMLVGLCGCKTEPAIDPITDGFAAQADIRYKEMDVKGQFSCSSDGRVNMEFSQPKSLDGVTLGFDGTSMQMKLGDMTISVAEDSMPDGGLIRRLSQVLAAVQPQEGQKKDGDYVITGTAEGVSYTLVCDAATGLPKSLSVPDEQLEVTFSQVTKL